MDETLRRAEQGSDAEKGDAVALAALLRKRQRAAETAVDLAEYSQDTRKAAFGLLEMSEDEQVRQEALVLFSNQIDHALESAIQPREGDAPLPDRETIFKSIERTLTSEQAKVFLNKKEIHKPTLVLVPVTSTERYIEALQEASQTMEDAYQPSFSNFPRNQLNRLATQAEVEGDKIKKWKFTITEGAQTFNIPSWDNSVETVQERINRFNRRYSSKSIHPIDTSSYIALMNQGLYHGKPIDCEYIDHSRSSSAIESDWQNTILNNTNENSDRVGVGRWVNLGRGVSLAVSLLLDRSDSIRFRPAVMGDIQ